MKRFLYWLTSRLPCRIISEGDAPYLERYYLFTVLGWRFYLHRFVRSDPDRGLHDHPWSLAFSIILSGWYYEETRTGVRKVRWFNTLTGDSFHRVVLPCAHAYPDMTCKDHARAGISHPIAPGVERPCWTLFFHRVGYVKSWGFLREVPDADGVAIFEPYNYAKEGSQRGWWLTAPKGRDSTRRMPA